MREMYGMDIKVVCDTKEVLESLICNRNRHVKIMKEARIGYLKKAKECLQNRMEELESGKIVSLSFSLSVPSSHVKEYDTVIQMLRLHQEKTITLNATEVRMFVQDQWEWIGQFLAQNAMYSAEAGTYNASRGSGDVEEED
ncbi:MAG: hypothetical protein ACXABY_19195 [Candidatus Thorarchaeota archaeon]|jgi:hypothetical protein